MPATKKQPQSRSATPKSLVTRQISLNGLLRNHEKLSLADQAITNKANILLTFELTASIAYLSTIKDTLTFQSPDFFFIAVAMGLLLGSIIMLIMTIMPQTYQLDFPDILDDMEIMDKEPKDFYDKVIKKVGGSIEHNSKIQEYKSKYYSRGAVLFLLAIAIVILSNAQQIFFNNISNINIHYHEPNQSTPLQKSNSIVP